MKLLNQYICFILCSQVCSMAPTKKICKDCRHFIPDNMECRNFGDTNLVTGKVTYHSANYIRKNETQCGENAIWFEKNTLKIITVPYYFCKEHATIMMATGILGLYIYALIHEK